MTTTILVGDVRERLKDIPDASVQCCVTSPPYYGLRSYLPTEHDDKHREIGSEPTLAEYIAAMVEVFRDVRRVLRDDGVCWLNIGDSYASNPASGGERISRSQDKQPGSHQRTPNTGWNRPEGLKPKDLMMVPARLAIALQDDGWWLRSDCIWAKPNPMPESVTDRPTSAHEHIFLLTKSARYFYDADAVAEDASEHLRRPNVANQEPSPVYAPPGQTPHSMTEKGGNRHAATRNLRNVWEIATQPFSGAHFAVFPMEIPRRCIKAGSKPGDTILDPFGGSGTTALVADQLGRNAILIELNPAYAELARERITSDAPMFAEVEIDAA